MEYKTFSLLGCSEVSTDYMDKLSYPLRSLKIVSLNNRHRKTTCQTCFNTPLYDDKYEMIVKVHPFAKVNGDRDGFYAWICIDCYRAKNRELMERN